MDNKEYDSLYHILLKFDYYKDLLEEELFPLHYEEDKTWNLLLESRKFDLDLEKIPLKFSSIDEYIKKFFSLFLIETRAQMAKSKYMDNQSHELFLLNLVKNDEKRKLCNFEFIKKESKNVKYSKGDIILIHKYPIDKLDQNEHSFGLVEKFTNNNTVILCKVDIDMNIPRYEYFAKSLLKNSEWYITKILNIVGICRDYLALMSADNILLSELLLNPNEKLLINTKNVDNDYIESDNKKHNNSNEEYFNIPIKLDKQLKRKFNYSQYHAIKSSLKKKGFTLIQGPPGTGKTTTILGIISALLNSTIREDISDRKDSVLLQISKEMLNKTDEINNNNNAEKNKKIKEENYMKTHPWLYKENPYDIFDIDFDIEDTLNYKEFEKDNKKDLIKPDESDISPPKRILICAPTNNEIDNLIIKLSHNGLFNNEGNNYKPKFIRIGMSYNDSLKEYSLDFLLNKYQQSKNKNQTFDDYRNSLLIDTNIICSTISMAGGELIASSDIRFDTIIIDDSTQATEISTLIPLQYKCERLILIGDPIQSSPKIFSSTAFKYNYHQSLFSRFQKAGHEVQLLKTQYRLQSKITKLISELFYNNQLENTNDKEDESTNNDNNNANNKINNELFSQCLCFQPITFFDIESKEIAFENSLYNEEQIEVIIQLIQNLFSIYKNDLNLFYNKLIILSPFAKQVLEIRNSLKKIYEENENNKKENKYIEVNTVDSYQGKEKNILIFSTVRSKGCNNNIGYLSNERLLNFAFTKAKNSLVIIGDSKVLIKNKLWEKIIKYSIHNGNFYKIKGNVQNYFKNFEKNANKYQIKNEKNL